MDRATLLRGRWGRFLSGKRSIKDQTQCPRKALGHEASSKQDEVRDFVGKGLDLAVKNRKEVGMGPLPCRHRPAHRLLRYSRNAKERGVGRSRWLKPIPIMVGQGGADTLALTAQNASPPLPPRRHDTGEFKQARGEHDASLASFTQAAEVALGCSVLRRGREGLRPGSRRQARRGITAAQSFRTRTPIIPQPHVQEVMALPGGHRSGRRRARHLAEDLAPVPRHALGPAREHPASTAY